MNKAGLGISGVLIAVIIALAVWQLTATDTENQGETNTFTVVDEEIQVDDRDMDAEKEDTDEDSDEEELDSDEGDEEEPAVSGTLYADGTYSTVAGYSSPAGKEEISVSLTLEDDIIVASTYTPLAENATSKKMQERFGDAYEEEVIGITIDELNLVAVGGASLTTNGFNTALAEIKADALVTK